MIATWSFFLPMLSFSFESVVCVTVLRKQMWQRMSICRIVCVGIEVDNFLLLQPRGILCSVIFLLVDSNAWPDMTYFLFN